MYHQLKLKRIERTIFPSISSFITNLWPAFKKSLQGGIVVAFYLVGAKMGLEIWHEKKEDLGRLEVFIIKHCSL